MESIEAINQPFSLWDKGKLFLKGIIIFVMALHYVFLRKTAMVKFG